MHRRNPSIYNDATQGRRIYCAEAPGNQKADEYTLRFPVFYPAFRAASASRIRLRAYFRTHHVTTKRSTDWPPPNIRPRVHYFAPEFEIALSEDYPGIFGRQAERVNWKLQYLVIQIHMTRQ